VQWKVVREMMTAWVITIPLALGISWAGYQIISVALTMF
jgi:PiT family inorganic phosphate transporter